MKRGKQERQITISEQTNFTTCDGKASWSYESIEKRKTVEWT